MILSSFGVSSSPHDGRMDVNPVLSGRCLVEAIVLWNEPNNLSHWDFKLDPGWKRFAEMVKLASRAIRRLNADLPIVLGGVSSCDCDFLRLMATEGFAEQRTFAETA